MIFFIEFESLPDRFELALKNRNVKNKLNNKNIEIYVDKCPKSSGELIALKSIEFEYENELGKKIQDLLILGNFMKQFDFVLPIKYYSLESNEKSKVFRLHYIMELADSTLADELNSRRKKKLSFTFIELVNISKSLCQIFMELQKNNLVHGNLKPENILYVKGNMKLSDFTVDEEKLMLNKYNQIKSDKLDEIYSCGAILLQCGLVTDFEYTKENIDLGLEKLKKQQEAWFVEVVKKMLKSSESFSFEEFYNLLNVYQEV